MGYKEQFGIEAGLQGSTKIDSDLIPQSEAEPIIAKAKARKEEKRALDIQTSLQKALYQQVRKGEITAHQADMIERGAPIQYVFNK